MRLAHVSDSHLGYRQGHRTAPGGMNQREHDAAEAFRHAVDGIIAARSDVVIHAGDVFDRVRPSNASCLVAYQQFRRLREELPETPIVVVAGNHEAPREAGVGSPLSILSELGVHVVTEKVETFAFPGLTVTAVPYGALHREDRSWMEPVGEGHRVLVLHGVVEGTVPTAPTGPVIPKALMESEGWSYIALGDWHVTRQMGPRAWYAGSTGYASTDIWSELQTPKGWLLVDLETGAVEPQPIPQARAIHDLPPIGALGLTPAELQAQMAAAVEQIPGGLAGAIVRLKVLDVPREVSRQLDHAAIRKWKDAALHFLLDLRKPETREVSGVARLRDGRRRTVEELVADYLGRRDLPPGMDRSEFLRVGAEVLKDDDYCGMPRPEPGEAA